MSTQRFVSSADFLDALASPSPVPGGGGASAFVGALGAALGSMVANLTSGKEKYRAVQGDIDKILRKAEALRRELLCLVDEDAEAFEPLSKAYGLPRATAEEKRERELVMERALAAACEPPLLIMAKSVEAMALHEELAEKGAKIALSDVGVGVLFCKSALMGASLNVFINVKSMKDRSAADAIKGKAEELLSEGMAEADRIYAQVEAALR